MGKKDKIIYGIVIMFMVTLINFSCNPHRRGHTAKQIGAGSGMKFHKRPASAKVKKRVKY